MCLSAITGRPDMTKCGIGWKVFRRSLCGGFRSWFFSARHVDLIPGKLIKAYKNDLDAIDLPCYVNSVDEFYSVKIEPLTYKEGFHIFLRREDAQRFADADDVISPVIWFGINAIGYNGADGISTEPVVVSPYMVFFDSDVDLTNSRDYIKMCWAGIRLEMNYNREFVAQNGCLVMFPFPEIPEVTVDCLLDKDRR